MATVGSDFVVRLGRSTKRTDRPAPSHVPRTLCVWATTILLLSNPLGLAAETIDPDLNGSQYAWSETTGWINAEPRGDGGPGTHIAADWITGWMWSENIGWISLSCENTASCAVVDYGVRHGTSGQLEGFAWAENAGWISFSCKNTGSCAVVDYGVTVVRGTGDISGFAWAENLGWISLSCTNTASCTNVDFGIKTTTPLPEHLFFDGFESGNTIIWSTTVQ